MKSTAKLFIAFAFLSVVFVQGCASRKISAASPSSSTVAPAATPYFLFFSDVHLDTTQVTTGKHQDAGTASWNNAMKKLRTFIDSSQPPAFVLYTGDLPTHYYWNEGDSSIFLPDRPQYLTDIHDAGVRRMLNGFSQLVAGTNIPFLYLPGNNDALVGDYFPFSNLGKASPDSTYAPPFSLMPSHSTDYPYDSFHVSKAPVVAGAYMLPNGHADKGYYAVQATKGLRVICLNSVMFSPNLQMADQGKQKQMSSDQMIWLGKQLADAAQNGNKVYLAMHIPPGQDYVNSAMWANIGGLYSPQDSLLNFVSRYGSTVAGVFFGHTHFEELRLLYDDDGNDPMQVAISCPGISPMYGNNPGFKTVSFHPTSKLPTDFTTYYSIPSDTIWGNKSYSFSNVFGASAADTSILQTLKGLKPDAVLAYLNTIYTVKSPKKEGDSLYSLQVRPTWLQNSGKR